MQETLKPERLASLEAKHICQVLQAATMLDYRHLGNLRFLLRAVYKKHRENRVDPIELQELLISCSRKPALIQYTEL